MGRRGGTHYDVVRPAEQTNNHTDTTCRIVQPENEHVNQLIKLSINIPASIEIHLSDDKYILATSSD